MNILLFLLGILKIIGIVLLVVLFIFLFVLFVILFSPLKYDLLGSKHSEISGNVSVKWIFGAIKINVGIDADIQTKIIFKVFGFTVFDSEHPKEKKEKTKRRREKRPKVQVAKKPVNTQKTVSTKNTESKNDKSEEKTEYKVKNIERSEVGYSEQRTTVGSEKITKEKVGEDAVYEIKPVIKRVKMSEILEPKINGPENLEKDIHEKKKKGKDKCKNTEKINLDYFKNMTFDEQKELLKITLGLLKNILKNVLPNNFFINGEIGTDDPCTTGYIIGCTNIAKGVLNKNINIIGNFQQKIITGEVLIKGKIIFAKLVYYTARFAFKKPIMKIIRIYLKG